MKANATIWTPGHSAIELIVEGEERDELESSLSFINELARLAGGHLQVWNAAGTDYVAGCAEEEGLDVALLKF